MILRATLVTASATAVTGIGPVGCTPDDADEPLQDGANLPQSVASGDPRADSVILWTRVDDSELADSDAELQLELAEDPEFTTLVELEGEARTLVPAMAMFDRCAKAKVRGLAPATTYYYRFIHSRSDGRYVSPVSHAKTAPAADSNVKLRFAYVSCQDFNGHYYNGYALLATMDLDFIVHLGDYIYETTGDPSFSRPRAGPRPSPTRPARSASTSAPTRSTTRPAASVTTASCTAPTAPIRRCARSMRPCP